MKYSNKFLDGKELHTKQWSLQKGLYGTSAVGNKQQQQLYKSARIKNK